MLDSEVHRNYQRLRYTVSQAWDQIPEEVVKAQIRTMHARCQAVIDAKGGYTQY